MSERERVIITGAGSGLGKEFTKLFLADGAIVLAVSLLDEELAALKRELDQYSDRLTTRVQDLSELDAAEKLVAYCDDQGWIIDTLVNNAGFGAISDVTDLPLEKIQSMISLNVLTTTKLSALFAAKMKSRRRGDILNVGSTAGMVPVAHFGVYCATKAYVNSFTFSLRAEVRQYGVNVTCLTPGSIATKFADTAGAATFSGNSVVKKAFDRGQAATPEEVAAAGYRGLRARKAHVLAGKGSRLAAMAGRLFPQSLLPGLMDRM